MTKQVSGPYSIGSLNREGPIQGVRGHREPMLGLGGGAPFRHGLRPNAVLAHQPCHTMLANAVPLFDQGIPDAGTAVGLPRLPVDHPNDREERTRLDRPGTFWS